MSGDGRSTFTAFELLILVAGAALLVGVVVPILGPMRTKARRITCTEHLRAIGVAFDHYLSDWQGVYPGSFAPAAKGDSPPHWLTLLGQAGARHGYDAPLQARPLNKYLADPVAQARCPLDKGDAMLLWDAPAYRFYGTSYIYYNRTHAQITAGTRVISDGVWAIEGQHKREIARPERKMILADLPVRLQRNADDSRSHWHGAKEPLLVNMLFADGHVAQTPRKTGVEAWNRDEEVSDEHLQVLSQTPYY